MRDDLRFRGLAGGEIDLCRLRPAIDWEYHPDYSDRKDLVYVEFRKQTGTRLVASVAAGHRSLPTCRKTSEMGGYDGRGHVGETLRRRE